MASKNPRVLFAADWGKRHQKRVVYKADVAQRVIQRVDGPDWSLHRLLETAREEVKAGRAPVVISLDLVLGTPAHYFRQVQEVSRWRHVRNFIDWLPLIGRETKFWQEVKTGGDWSVQQPFCSVPKGQGSLTAFNETAGYELRRRVDIRCCSKSPFVVSGIPGSVGSGTRSLWQELAPLVAIERDFKIWPFEGRMSQLLEDQDIIIAENYPGISYTSALGPRLPSPRVMVSKTKIPSRIAAVNQLEKAAWVAATSVKLPDLEPARSSEDDFDALLTVAGELRCVLEEYVLEDPATDDPVAEGGILLTSVIDFNLPAKILRADGETERPRKQVGSKRVKSGPKNRSCPILGCSKVFVQTRRGWDPHVGSTSQHPGWHPEFQDPKLRRSLFRQEFPAFFQ